MLNLQILDHFEFRMCLASGVPIGHRVIGGVTLSLSGSFILRQQKWKMLQFSSFLQHYFFISPSFVIYIHVIDHNLFVLWYFIFFRLLLWFIVKLNLKKQHGLSQIK